MCVCRRGGKRAMTSSDTTAAVGAGIVTVVGATLQPSSRADIFMVE